MKNRRRRYDKNSLMPRHRRKFLRPVQLGNPVFTIIRPRDRCSCSWANFLRAGSRTEPLRPISFLIRAKNMTEYQCTVSKVRVGRGVEPKNQKKFVSTQNFIATKLLRASLEGREDQTAVWAAVPFAKDKMSQQLPGYLGSRVSPSSLQLSLEDSILQKKVKRRLSIDFWSIPA
jgi:hypothetical protein